MGYAFRYGIFGKAIERALKQDNLLLCLLLFALGGFVFYLASQKKEYHPIRKVLLALCVYQITLGFQITAICLLAPLVLRGIIGCIGLFGGPEKPAPQPVTKEERRKLRDDALKSVELLAYDLEDCLTEASKQRYISEASTLYIAPHDSSTSDIEFFLRKWRAYEYSPEPGSVRGS